MKTSLYFYTGTGNSLWTARKLSEHLGDTELIPMTFRGHGPINTKQDNIGFIFPVHIWGLPPLVIDFINRMVADPSKYYFALAVNAGQVAATLLQLKKLLLLKNSDLCAGFSINMPSNYIPWGGAIAQGKQQIKFTAALEKINRIAAIVRTQKNIPFEKGPLWQNIIFSFFYRKSFPYVHKMDKSFWADDKCNTCRICEKICPVHNILITEDMPIWQHHCEQCFACLQWCPEESIQYGKNTKGKKRYRHPEIKLSDMLASVDRK